MSYVYWWLDEKIPAVKIGHGATPLTRMEGYAVEYRMAAAAGSLQQHLVPHGLSCEEAEKHLHAAMRLNGHSGIKLAGRTLMSSGAQEVFALSGKTYLDVCAFLAQELSEYIKGASAKVNDLDNDTASPISNEELNRLGRAEVLKLALARGTVEELKELGLWYRHGWASTPQDSKTALNCYLAAANQGDPEAQFVVGQMLSGGEGAPKNSNEALKWYKCAASNGNAYAQSALGETYYFGRGVPRDLRSAAYWLSAAMQHDEPPVGAALTLGVMHQNGEGVVQDFAKAASLLRQEITRSQSTKAKLQLAGMYERGDGVICDYEQALNLYLDAVSFAEAPEAMMELGRMYEAGVGVPRDLVRAHMWFNVAAAYSSNDDRNMCDDAVRKRDAIARNMSRDQIQQAQKLAAEFGDPTLQFVG